MVATPVPEQKPKFDNHFITELFDWKQPPLPRNLRIINSILSRLGCFSRLTLPVRTGSWTNVERRMNMYHLASQVLAFGVPGDLVELGCNAGHSCVLIQKVIDLHDPSRRLHAYDSFEGLPDPRPEDAGTPCRRGSMATSLQTLLNNFLSVGLKLPEVHCGWFAETLSKELPDQICFAHLDGDLYDSILISLENVFPRLSKGAICLVDDYGDPALPGVQRACDKFLADKPENIVLLYAGNFSHAYFRKL